MAQGCAKLSWMGRDMKRIISFLLVLAFVCGISILGCSKQSTNNYETTEIASKPTSEPTSEQNTSQMDSILHKAICESLGYKKGTELTDEDYLNVTSISIFNEDIQSIEGISKLTNLMYLTITNGKLTDISELATLENIVSVDVSNNYISEIPDFSNCKAIETIYIGGNLIEDISPLNEINTLKYVNISNNKINSLEALKDNTVIESLIIDNNCILGYDCIAENRSLTGAIDNGSQTNFERCFETEQMAKDIVATFPKNLSELELEKYIYQYVIDNMEYELVYRDSTAFAYYALKEGIGVCGDYAELFCILANHAGLEAYVCSSETHAWNTVVIDGVTYHCDTLWDEGQEEWIYFNLSGEEIGKVEDHSFDERRY